VVSVLDLPASAVDTPPPLSSQVTPSVVSCCPMYFLSSAAGGSNTSAVLLPESVASSAAVTSRQIPAGDMSVGMEWYSGESSRPPRTLPDGPRIDMLDLTELGDFSGLSDCQLDDLLQPGCGMSGDFMNVTDDCDLCSPAGGVRATFEKLMEVTTSKS